MKRLCIIPARGGSKRIFKKNIKHFLGKPIISYAICEAINSDLFDEVMVSTDDIEIADVALKYGAKVPFYRSDKNADDYATTVDVIIEVLNQYMEMNVEFEQACCIYPTAVFLSYDLISSSLDLLNRNCFDSVFPVIENSYPIQRSIIIDSNSKMSLFQPEALDSRSQDLGNTYHDSGQYYWFNVPSILIKKKLWTENSGVVVIKESEGHDIDSIEDWKIAEIKYKLLQGKGKIVENHEEKVFPLEYQCLNQEVFAFENYSIVPIRFQDRYDIMKWRNEQQFHLRQNETLTKEVQEKYFKNIVSKLFVQNKPDQILFSFIKDSICIGYGGLVHINWEDKNAEISFLMNTELQKTYFENYWGVFLRLLEKVAFEEFRLHKIYTYAFDVRPKLYKVLEINGYTLDARLSEHCYFNNKFVDVVIHQKKSISQFELRKANIKDVDMLFHWSNDELVRKQSYNSSFIEYKEHSLWFKKELNNDFSLILIASIRENPIGVVRFSISDDFSTIGISLDSKYRSKGYSSKILKLGINYYFEEYEVPIRAYIKSTNKASIRGFEKAGFIFLREEEVENITSRIYQLKQIDEE